VPNLVAEGTPFTRGAFVEMASGNDVAIIAAGSMVSRAIAAASILKQQGVSARVLNATFIAPLDVAAIKKAAAETRGIVTVEEANVAGGLGAAVASVLGTLDNSSRVPLRIVGTDDWSPTLSTDALYTHFGLTAENIALQASEVLSRD